MGEENSGDIASVSLLYTVIQGSRQSPYTGICHDLYMEQLVAPFQYASRQ